MSLVELIADSHTEKKSGVMGRLYLSCMQPLVFLMANFSNRLSNFCVFAVSRFERRDVTRKAHNLEQKILSNNKALPAGFIKTS
ncbi:hypothetical protein N836_31840 [Leptolyngbya sp. Heron Island J]|nr:hypothetical protein N836_31840 [Leptolyngbya sp. Heron Island J]